MGGGKDDQEDPGEQLVVTVAPKTLAAEEGGLPISTETETP